MAELTTFTFADKPLYTRVKSTRDTINRRLIESLMIRGIKEENIRIETEEVPKDNECCQRIKVIAYGKPTRTTKTSDESDYSV